MSDFKTHLQKLSKCKSDLGALKGTPIPGGDVTGLQNRLDALAKEVKDYLQGIESVSKDLAQIKELEKKVAPSLSKLNGLLDKMETDATEAQKIAGKMTGTLSKLPAFKKANDYVDFCYEEFFGLRSKAGVKLKSDGNLNL